MRRNPTQDSTGVKLVEAHHRLALWAGLICVVVLVLALGLTRSAQAQTSPPSSAATGFPLTAEEDEESLEDEEEGKADPAECALEAQEEAEEGEPIETECEEEAEEEENSELGVAPTECFVRTTVATVATNTSNDTVNLALRYTSWTPASVSVSYRLRGAKGSLALGHATKHFGKKGVLKLTASLTDAEMVQAKAAHEFDVAVHAINSPGYCSKIFAERLSAHKAVGKSSLWSSPRAG